MCDACGRPGRLPDCPDIIPGDAAWIRRRETFYRRVLGPPREPAVFHWDDDRDPHVDVYVHTSPAGDVVVTGGLADRPMPGMRANGDHPRRVELLVRMQQAGDWVPPILREVAALPFRHGLPLRAGGLVEGSGPIRPGSRLRHALLVPATVDEGLTGFLVDGEEVAFLRLVFLTQSEYDFTLRIGAGPLLRRLDFMGAIERLLPDRRAAI